MRLYSISYVTCYLHFDAVTFSQEALWKSIFVRYNWWSIFTHWKATTNVFFTLNTKPNHNSHTTTYTIYITTSNIEEKKRQWSPLLLRCWRIKVTCTNTQRNGCYWPLGVKRVCKLIFTWTHKTYTHDTCNKNKK